MLILNREAGELVELTGDICVKVRNIRGTKTRRLIDLEILKPGQPVDRKKALQAGDSFSLTSECTVKIIRCRGREVGVGFDAPAHVNIWRSELQQH